MPKMMQWLHGAVTLLLAAALGVEVTKFQALSDQLTELENRIAAVESGEAPPINSSEANRRLASAATQRTRRSTSGTATAASGTQSQVVEEEVAEVVEATMEEMLEQREEERKAEATEKWIDQASESSLIEIERAAETYDISEEKVEAAHAVLVDSLYATIELKEALDAEELTVREAKAEGNVLLKEIHDELVGLLGDEATEELGAAIRPGRGWKPD